MKDFNRAGGFQAFYKDLYNEAQKIRSDLGMKPMQAAVDPEAEVKIRKNGNYKPFENYDDCLKLLIRSTLKYAALRGNSEVSFLFLLVLSFFIFFCLIIFYFSLIF